MQRRTGARKQGAERMTERAVYRLPEAPRNLRLREMTEAQQALAGLATGSGAEGVDIRFERNELPEHGLRFVRRIDAPIVPTDDHVVDFNRFHSVRAPSVNESA